METRKREGGDKGRREGRMRNGRKEKRAWKGGREWAGEEEEKKRARLKIVPTRGRTDF
jgi:hypothetical protein